MNTPGTQAFAYIGQVLAGDSPQPIQPAPSLEQPQASADAEPINESEKTACLTNT